MKQIEKTIQTMRQERGWDVSDTPEILAKSIIIEAAELLECYQWGPNADRDAVKGEVADVLMYAISLCIDMGWDFEQIIEEKIADVAQRYPRLPEC